MRKYLTFKPIALATLEINFYEEENPNAFRPHIADATTAICELFHKFERGTMMLLEFLIWFLLVL